VKGIATDRVYCECNHAWLKQQPFKLLLLLLLLPQVWRIWQQAVAQLQPC
jgi:hypothetical protein